MKYLIFGLGNIGQEYRETRHNIGFKILDELAGSSGIFFESDRYAARAEYKFKGRKLILLKPSTYMNNSGKAVNYWMQKEKVLPDNILIITDDIALPFGTIRLRGKGSDGGHNGLKSIIETIGTTKFPRLRFGIGNDFYPGKQVEYVLGDWTEEEKEKLPERIGQSVKVIQSFVTVGLGTTMSAFNNK